jgi:hypothetical protein
MSDVHIFIEKAQKATSFVDRHGPKPVRIRIDPRCQVYCFDCDRRRWAKNMAVRVYYDCTRFYCSPCCPPRKKGRRLARRRLPLPATGKK